MNTAGGSLRSLLLGLPPHTGNDEKNGTAPAFHDNGKGVDSSAIDVYLATAASDLGLAVNIS